MTSSFHTYRAAQARRISSRREAAKRKRLSAMIGGAASLVSIIQKQNAYETGVAEAKADAAISSARNHLALLGATRQATVAIDEAIASLGRTQVAYKGLRTTIASGVVANTAKEGKINALFGAQKQAVWFGVQKDSINQAKAAAMASELSALRSQSVATILGKFADKQSVLGILGLNDKAKEQQPSGALQ